MTARTPSRLARNASAAVVAGIAAWSSYSHMVHVALSFGERPEVAYVLPFSVDGMLVVAASAMLHDKQSGHRVRPTARLAFAAGVLASIAANIAAAEPSVGARIVAAWPALALLLVVEMLSRSGRAHRPPPAAAGAGRKDDLADGQVAPAAEAEVPTEQPAYDAVVRRAAAEVPAAEHAGAHAAVRVVSPAEVAAEQPGPPPPIPRQGGGEAQPRRSRQPAAVTRRLATEIISGEPGITRKEVAARVGVSARRLREVLAEEP